MAAGMVQCWAGEAGEGVCDMVGRHTMCWVAAAVVVGGAVVLAVSAAALVTAAGCGGVSREGAVRRVDGVVAGRV